MNQFFQNFIHLQRLQLGFRLPGKGEEVLHRIGQPVELRFDNFESTLVFGLKIPILENELKIAEIEFRGVPIWWAMAAVTCPTAASSQIGSIASGIQTRLR